LLFPIETKLPKLNWQDEFRDASNAHSGARIMENNPMKTLPSPQPVSSPETNTMTKFVLPYESQYTGHREAEKRHKETQDWLRRREPKVVSPSIVP
jgi:hypothetical protein